MKSIYDRTAKTTKIRRTAVREAIASLGIIDGAPETSRTSVHYDKAKGYPLTINYADRRQSHRKQTFPFFLRFLTENVNFPSLDL